MTSTSSPISQRIAAASAYLAACMIFRGLLMDCPELSAEAYSLLTNAERYTFHEAARLVQSSAELCEELAAAFRASRDAA